MICTTKPKPYKLEDVYHQQNLNIKEECTFMGVILDNKLKCNKHFQIIGKISGKSIGSIYKLRRVFTMPCHTILSYTNTYFIVILFGQIRKKFILKLRLDYKKIRVICNKRFLAHTIVPFE